MSPSALSMPPASTRPCRLIRAAGCIGPSRGPAWAFSFSCGATMWKPLARSWKSPLDPCPGNAGCMALPGRVADYNRIAENYDRRYALHAYAGVRDALFNSLDSGPVSAALEVGCGTGHWLTEIRSQYPSAERLLLAGVEPSA